MRGHELHQGRGAVRTTDPRNYLSGIIMCEVDVRSLRGSQANLKRWTFGPPSGKLRSPQALKESHSTLCISSLANCRCCDVEKKRSFLCLQEVDVHEKVEWSWKNGPWGASSRRQGRKELIKPWRASITKILAIRTVFSE